ncbi:MAG: hypothetical protein QF464_20005, partial [Myxococcota bacterium]|nr:hypothetical protein [Myxococcota bacterium]
LFGGGSLRIVKTVALRGSVVRCGTEVELVEAEQGVRLIEEPMELRFSEPIDPETLSVNIWLEEQLDGEGEFGGSAEPIFGPCAPEVCPEVGDCEGLGLCVSPDGLFATATFGDAFEPYRGAPLLLETPPGLSDLAGNARGTATRHPFQVSPECGLLPTGGPVDIALNSGVVTLVASLADGNEAIRALYPSLYLRLLVDILVDEDTGATWLLATVARLHEDVKAENPTSSAPLDRAAILDGQGWAVLIEGALTACPDGTFWLETQPRTVSVWVLGTISVVLEDFQLTGTVAPGHGEDGRDQMWGGLSASTATIKLGDVSDLGSVAASFSGDGLFSDEVEAALPRVCSDNPCVDLDASGGDCQVPAPWTIPAVCP